MTSSSLLSLAHTQTSGKQACPFEKGRGRENRKKAKKIPPTLSVLGRK